MEKYKPKPISQLHIVESNTAVQTPIITLPKRKTKKMVEIEDRLGEPIKHILLELYHDRQFSKAETSKYLNVPVSTIKNWLAAYRIPLRSNTEGLAVYSKRKGVLPFIDQTNTEIQEKRLQGLRRAYSERKDEIVAKLQTPEVKKKRTQALKKKFKTDPMYRLNMSLAQQALVQKRRAQEKKNREEIFGTDERTDLELRHRYLAQLTSDIAEDTGLSTKTIRSLLKAYEIPITEATPPDAVRRFQEVQKLLWQNPELFASLKRYEKNIVYHRYMTEGPMPTLEEVGQKMNVSREWVRTVDNRVIDIFKKNAKKGEREDE